MALKVLLADDHRLTLAGARRVPDESGDLVVLDRQMPKGDGLSCLDLIRRHHPTLKVIIFSATTAAAEISTALQNGACAYVLKTVNPLDLPAVIRQAAEGTVYYPPPSTA